MADTRKPGDGRKVTSQINAEVIRMTREQGRKETGHATPKRT